MKTLQLATFVILMTFLSNFSSAQDFLSFTALAGDGYGVYATGVGHTIPGDPCVNFPNAYAFETLASADLAPAGSFPGTKAALKLQTGGTGFTSFNNALTANSYSLNDVEMKFTITNMGPDIENQDWFMIDEMETRFYYNGTFTFYVAGLPIVKGTMPVFQLEIDYNDMPDCGDDVIYAITQYTTIVDDSAGQPAAIQAIAAALLADVGTKSIRFSFSQLQAAIVQPTGFIFQSTTGKIELGMEYDNLTAASINEPATGSCITPSTPITSSGSGNWLHILNSSERVASILDSENMGIINSEFYLNGGAVRASSGGVEYMDRNFTLTPTVQPTNPVRVRLYFTASEWTNFKAANPTDLKAMSDISISKFTSSDCDAINNATGEVKLPILEYGYIHADNSYYLDVQVTSFSTFFVHGPTASSVLPVELVNFSGRATNRGVELNWQTASETNNSGFEIQKSEDGINWNRIGWKAGKGTTSTTQNYSYLDNSTPTTNHIYYRLKQIDYDEKYDFSATLNIQLKIEKGSIGQFYPNPSQTKIVQLDFQAEQKTQATISFYNAMGKLILQKTPSITEGTNQLNFDLTNLNQGIYLVKINTKLEDAYRKLIIE